MKRSTANSSANLGLIVLILIVHCASGIDVTEGNATVPEVQNKTERVLTGNPQKDYLLDPNLPRELKGFDLSNYPFYKRVPNVEFNFTCDDRHDGFYASIPHECQVYHHCLFGIRYDFLCANYTAFDQSNFICHFANEVDCKNSELYYSRNDALYKEETTTTTTTAAPQVKIVYVERTRPNKRRQGGTGGRRKKPTPKPAADEYYYDYYEEESPKTAVAETKVEKTNNNDEYYYYDDYEPASTSTSTTTTTTTTTARPLLKRKRPNRPLRTRLGAQGSSPSKFNDYHDYDADAAPINRQDDRGQRPQNQKQPQRKRRRRKKTTTTTSTTTTTTTPEPEYYDDYYYYDDYTDSTTASTTTKATPQPQRRRTSPALSRPSAQERRMAILQSRKSQLHAFARPDPTPQPSRVQTNEPVDIQYDDENYTDYPAETNNEPSAASAVDYDVQVQSPSTSQNGRQTSRRRGTFQRTQTHTLRDRPSRA